MKKLILMTMVMLASVPALAQDDDLYFTPKKDSAIKAAKQTYYVGSDRDVDEYNRLGQYRNNPLSVADSDVVFFDEVKGEYPDSLGLVKKKSYADNYNDYDGDDYAYSRELNRWYGFYDPWFYDRYYGFYSPFYSSYYGWYDPWYYPYYGGWYGYHNPWYYSYYGGWYDPWWYGGFHHHDWYVAPVRHRDGGIGMGYSNRGHVNTGSGAAGGYANRGVNYSSGRGNVYNDIAKRSDNNNGRRVVSSNRTVGSRQSNFNSSRSGYTNTYRGQDNNSSAFSGSNRSFSNGGGFSGGGLRGGGGFSGGGSRGGGGFSGGGGHGGRR